MVADYRIYMLDGSGRISSACDHRCDSDTDAEHAARALLGSSGQAEIWQGTRCLGRVSAAAEAGRAAHVSH